MLNVVHNMDCMDFLRAQADKSFDLAIVDPPYGIKMGGGKMGGDCLARNKNYKVYVGEDKSSPDRTYFQELRRVSKNQIIFGANHFATKINADSSCWIVWDKENGNNNFADCELAFTSFKTAVRKFTYRWQGMLQGDMANKENRIHPNQKPVALYKWLLKHYAKAGDRILDTHVGSGSSRIACHDMGYEFTGCELDPDYWAAQEARFKKHCSQGELFEFVGGKPV